MSMMAVAARLSLLAPGVHCAPIKELPVAEYIGPGCPAFTPSPLYFECPNYRAWLKMQIDNQEPNPHNLELKRLAWLFKQKGRLWIGYDERSKVVAEIVGRAVEWVVRESIPLAGKATPIGARNPDDPFRPGDIIALRCAPRRRMIVIDVTEDIMRDQGTKKPIGPVGWARQHSYRVQVDDGNQYDAGHVGHWLHNLVIPYEPVE